MPTSRGRDARYEETLTNSSAHMPGRPAVWLPWFLAAYWPAVYFGFYLPFIVPREGWSTWHLEADLLTGTYIIALLATGLCVSVRLQLLCGAAIGVTVAVSNMVRAWRCSPDSRRH